MWFSLYCSKAVSSTYFKKHGHLFWIPSTMKLYNVLWGEVAIKGYNVLEMILDESNIVLWDLRGLEYLKILTFISYKIFNFNKGMING